MIDEGKYGPGYHLKCRDLVMSAWKDEEVKPANKYEERLLHNVSYLKRMQARGFKYGEEVYKEWLKSFEIGYKKARTKGRIIPWNEIQKLTAESGRNLVATTLYFSIPEIGKKNIDIIADEFGPVVKEADNLADVYQDAEEGYVKVPINFCSGIEHSHGVIKKINLKKFKVDPKYVRERFAVLDTRFWEADKKLMQIVSKKQVDQKILTILRFRAFSWLLNVKDVHEF
ncbi:MAG: hypothetical protein QMC80_05730 [Thermoplasmatales archaeon]|nr:hypothetical protein [Thermoplasmatales archaeon]